MDLVSIWSPIFFILQDVRRKEEAAARGNSNWLYILNSFGIWTSDALNGDWIGYFPPPWWNVYFLSGGITRSQIFCYCDWLKWKIPAGVTAVVVLWYCITVQFDMEMSNFYPSCSAMFILQLELFLRRKTGHHFSLLFIMTLQTKYQFIYKGCNMLHLQHI